MSLITLASDFGWADGYVAAMKGVIARVAPGVTVVDATHGLPFGDVETAAWVLSSYWREFPPGTVHLVVVDPGVGTSRRGIVLQAGGGLFVGPDNGVFHHVLTGSSSHRAFSLDERHYQADVVSGTFHGRDIFAPAAAWLAKGVDPSEMGPAVSEPVQLALPAPRRARGGASGSVTHIDHFGNVITDLPASWIPEDAVVIVGEHRIEGLVKTYGDVPIGTVCALIGSNGTLELGRRDGNASESLRISKGASVVVEM